MMDQLFPYFVVDKSENGFVLVNQRDFNVQRVEHGCVLGADNAATKHDQALRDFLHPQDAIAIDDGVIVKRYIVRSTRACTGRQQNLVRLEFDNFAVGLFDQHVMWICKSRVTGQRVNIVPVKLFLQQRNFVVDRDIESLLQVRRGNGFLQPVPATIESALTPARKV